MRTNLLTMAAVTAAFALFMFTPTTALVAAKSGCVTIQSGTLLASNGDVLQVGQDQYGYNYQARQFNGDYGNYSRPAQPVETGIELIMKWNDAWLSNQDCDDDGLLDRHLGYSSYIDSGAWITNHIRWVEDGQQYSYFIKIVAVSSSDTLAGGMWYTADGVEIGPEIWGQFAIVQEVLSGEGALYVSPAGPGLGN